MEEKVSLPSVFVALILVSAILAGIFYTGYYIKQKKDEAALSELSRVEENLSKTMKVNEKISETLDRMINNLIELKKSVDEEREISQEIKSSVRDIQKCNILQRNVTVTSYTNNPEETDDTPDITASNNKVREGIVAVSRDLLKSIAPFGTKICFASHEREHSHQGHDESSCPLIDKCFIVEDTMHKRKQKQVDVFTFDKKKALTIGRGKSLVRIYNCQS